MGGSYYLSISKAPLCTCGANCIQATSGLEKKKGATLPVNPTNCRQGRSIYEKQKPLAWRSLSANYAPQILRTRVLMR